MFFTDGVIEAVNTDGDVFGSDRIDAALRDLPADRRAADPDASCANSTAFTAGIPVADDRTLVVVKRT